MDDCLAKMSKLNNVFVSVVDGILTESFLQFVMKMARSTVLYDGWTNLSNKKYKKGKNTHFARSSKHGNLSFPITLSISC